MHWFWRAAIAVMAGGLFAVLLLFSEHVPAIRRFIIATASLGGSIGEMTVRIFFAFVIPSALAVATYAFLTHKHGPHTDTETRCRRCGYILRGITEPRCPECGERI